MKVIKYLATLILLSAIVLIASFLLPQSQRTHEPPLQEIGVVHEINYFRSENKLSEFVISEELNRSSEDHCKKIQTDKDPKLALKNDNAQKYFTVKGELGFLYHYDNNDPKKVLRSWTFNSPTKKVLLGKYKYFGVGVCNGNTNNLVIVHLSDSLKKFGLFKN